jgi:hypothetical protein
VGSNASNTISSAPARLAFVDAFFAAQSPDVMRNETGAAPDRVPVKTPRCAGAGAPCPIVEFAMPLVTFIEMARPVFEQNRGCLSDWSRAREAWL